MNCGNSFINPRTHTYEEEIYNKYYYMKDVVKVGEITGLRLITFLFVFAFYLLRSIPFSVIV